MLNLTVNISGKTSGDLELALEEVLKSVQRGNTMGFDGNDDGDYSFSITGEEETLEKEIKDFFSEFGEYKFTKKEQFQIDSKTKAIKITKDGIEADDNSIWEFDQIPAEDLEDIKFLIEEKLKKKKAKA